MRRLARIRRCESLDEILALGLDSKIGYIMTAAAAIRVVCVTANLFSRVQAAPLLSPFHSLRRAVVVSQSGVRKQKGRRAPALRGQNKVDRLLRSCFGNLARVSELKCDDTCES
jgi:hypothetical protein